MFNNCVGPGGSVGSWKVYYEDESRGLNVGEKLSLDFYNGNFRNTDILFVKPKESNPTPRKCAIISERLSLLFGLPVVFILAPAMTYERQRLMEKGVYMIVVVENMTPEFGQRFWNFIKEAGYRPERRSLCSHRL